MEFEDKILAQETQECETTCQGALSWKLEPKINKHNYFSEFKACLSICQKIGIYNETTRVAFKIKFLMFLLRTLILK
jgi:hypothetical protein